MLPVSSGAFSFLYMDLISSLSLLISAGETYRKALSICSRAFVSLLGHRKMGREVEVERH